MIANTFPEQAYFLFFRDNAILLVWRNEIQMWDLPKGITREQPDGRFVEMALAQYFCELSVDMPEAVTDHVRNGNAVLHDSEFYVCETDGSWRIKPETAAFMHTKDLSCVKLTMEARTALSSTFIKSRLS